MKVKRIMAVLLAAALLALFGVQGVGAASQPPSIERSGSWQQAEFRWQMPENAQDLDYRWEILRLTNPAAPEEDQIWSNVQTYHHVPGKSQHIISGAIVREIDGTSFLSMGPSYLIQGYFHVRLIVGDEIAAEDYVWLADDSALQHALDEAKRLTARSRRYTKEYIAKLQGAIADAQALYAADWQVTPDDIAARTTALVALMAQPELSMTGSDFLNRLVPGWWKFVDFATAPLRWLQARADLLWPMFEQVVAAVFTFRAK